VFPMTFLGKKLILKTVLENLPSGTIQQPTKSCAGRTGTALTDLRPSGTARIDGARLSVVTAGEYIEQDSPVIVVQHEGSRIVVRRFDGESHES
jgi:membrane-bound serine protease (ClpP class)